MRRTTNEVPRGPKRVGSGWWASSLLNSDGSDTGENGPDAGERPFIHGTNWTRRRYEECSREASYRGKNGCISLRLLRAGT